MSYALVLAFREVKWAIGLHNSRKVCHKVKRGQRQATNLTSFLHFRPCQSVGRRAGLEAVWPEGAGLRRTILPASRRTAWPGEALERNG